MPSKSYQLSRRTLLRGFGAMLTLPYLEVMGGKTIAATAGQVDPPRLACFYIPGAVNRHNWFPKETGFEYTLSPSHEPLAEFRDQFSVLTNLSHIQGQISGHVHPYNWLTGHNINLTPGAHTNTVSMDQIAAKHIGKTWLPSMALSHTSGVGTATLSRNALGVDIPATRDYRAVFERLFPPANADDAKRLKARLELDRSVLDTAMGQVTSVRKNLGAIDRRRIDQYLDSVRDLERRLIDRETMLLDGRPKFDESGVRVEAGASNNMAEHIEIMVDLIALAFQTDMTRVVTHCLGGEGGPNYEDYKAWANQAGGQLRGAHDFHHKGGQGGADSADAKVIGYRDKMFCAQIGRLMQKLKSIEAHKGTLLDHTVLLLGGSQISSHSGKSFPMLLAGGKGLGFKHGQHLKWKRGIRSASDLYLTILQQMRCPVESFKESQGPISEILV